MKPPKTVGTRVLTLPPDSVQLRLMDELRLRLTNLEKALRSAEFLIDWASDIGNKPLDGDLSFGMIQVLGHCAMETAQMRLWVTNEFMKPPVRRAARSGSR
jgi:hypothetical protein